MFAKLGFVDYFERSDRGKWVLGLGSEVSKKKGKGARIAWEQGMIEKQRVGQSREKTIENFKSRGKKKGYAKSTNSGSGTWAPKTICLEIREDLGGGAVKRTPHDLYIVLLTT